MSETVSTSALASQAAVSTTATQPTTPTPSVAEPPAAAPKRTSLASKALTLLAAGHCVTDFHSSAVSTLQPVLVDRYALTLAQAGVVGGVFMFGSSVLQLPFGMLSDRVRSRMFSVLGPLAAGVFLSCLGLAVGFKSLLLLIALGGVGVAAFQPQSATEATLRSGERRGMGMALFITAGTFGLALGPPVFSAIIETFSFEAFPIAMAPGVLVAALLLWGLPQPMAHAKTQTGVDWAALGAKWKPLSLHYTLVLLRSTVQLSFAQFVSIYLMRERGYTLTQASYTLAMFFLAASIGSFTGGHLSDRIGGKKVIVLSMIGASPFFGLFLATTGWVSTVSLFLGGAFLLLTIPVNVVMAQELVPSQAGTVTSLMMGFSWGIAGITFMPLIGSAAEHFGLQAVLWAVALLPLPGFLLSLKVQEKAA